MEPSFVKLGLTNVSFGAVRVKAFGYVGLDGLPQPKAESERRFRAIVATSKNELEARLRDDRFSTAEEAVQTLSTGVSNLFFVLRDDLGNTRRFSYRSVVTYSGTVTSVFAAVMAWWASLVIVLLLAPLSSICMRFVSSAWFRRASLFSIPLLLAFPVVRRYLLTRYRRARLSSLEEESATEDESKGASAILRNLEDSHHIHLVGTEEVTNAALRQVARRHLRDRSRGLVPILLKFPPAATFGYMTTMATLELANFGGIEDESLASDFLRQGGFLLAVTDLNEETSPQSKLALERFLATFSKNDIVIATQSDTDRDFAGYKVIAVHTQAGDSQESVEATTLRSASAPANYRAGEAIRLKSMTISGLRGFRGSLSISCQERSLSRPQHAGQWIVFLGDNGAGKTTILRSLVLALAEPDAAIALIKLKGSAAPFLHYAKGQGDSGGVKVVLNGEEYESRITNRSKSPSRAVEELKSITPSSERFPLFAYGCHRGSVLGGPRRDVELRSIDNVFGLFEETASLIHAETWLRELEGKAFKKPDSPASSFFQAVKASVVAILDGVERLDFSPDDAIWLEGPRIGRAPLAALSDGYSTTAGWVIDMIARWAEGYRDAGGILDGNFVSQMKGLVLIDEIDLHLHPRWQTEIISTLRQQFPQMSFVATTHNPLTLLGLDPGELHLLIRDSESGEIVHRKEDVPPGTRADQVLTGEWFGLSSTLDPDTLRLLDKHRDLLRRRRPVEDLERKRLEEKLKSRLGVFADTSIDRMVQSVAADLMREDLSKSSVEERKELRDKILERARRRKQREDRY